MMNGSWYWLDIAIMSLMVLSMLVGFFRGFVKELTSLGIWIAAVFLAIKLAPLMDHWLNPYVHEASLRYVLALVLIFIAVLLLGALFNALLSLVLKHAGLSGVDRLLGFGFGLIRGVFVIALFFLVLQITAVPYQQYTQKSWLYPKFVPIVHWMRGFMPDFIQQVRGMDSGSKSLVFATNDVILDV